MWGAYEKTPRCSIRRALRVIISLVLLLPPGLSLGAQPQIRSLDRSDPLYLQHQELVAEYYQSVASGQTPPPLFFMYYAPASDETLFEIASRLMLPYSTISTLNRLQDTRLPQDGTLLLPTQPGLFLFDESQSILEEALRNRLEPESAMPLVLPESAERVHWFPGSDFSPRERQLFLTVMFDDPLPEGVISSHYGYRFHPVSGLWAFHHGIDIAADYGTSVRSAASGIVRSVSRDPWLGLSVEIDHIGEYTTVYAHLQELFVTPGTFVERNSTIGTVGSTGLSTGPHLHFEVRYRGESKNPNRYLLRETE